MNTWVKGLMVVSIFVMASAYSFADEIVAVVKNGKVHPLSTSANAEYELTRLPQTAAGSPAIEDLAHYEGQILLIEGTTSANRIWSAKIIDNAGVRLSNKVIGMLTESQGKGPR